MHIVCISIICEQVILYFLILIRKFGCPHNWNSYNWSCTSQYLCKKYLYSILTFSSSASYMVKAKIFRVWLEIMETCQVYQPVYLLLTYTIRICIYTPYTIHFLLINKYIKVKMIYLNTLFYKSRLIS